MEPTDPVTVTQQHQNYYLLSGVDARCHSFLFVIGHVPFKGLRSPWLTPPYWTPPHQNLTLWSQETLCYAKTQRGRKSSQTILRIRFERLPPPGPAHCVVFGGLLTPGGKSA